MKKIVFAFALCLFFAGTAFAFSGEGPNYSVNKTGSGQLCGTGESASYSARFTTTAQQEGNANANSASYSANIGWFNSSSSQPYCGDRICNGDETCASCPLDCGVCPPPSGSGSKPPEPCGSNDDCEERQYCDGYCYSCGSCELNGVCGSCCVLIGEQDPDCGGQLPSPSPTLVPSPNPGITTGPEPFQISHATPSPSSEPTRSLVKESLLEQPLHQGSAPLIGLGLVALVGVLAIVGFGYLAFNKMI